MEEVVKCKNKNQAIKKSKKKVMNMITSTNSNKSVDKEKIAREVKLAALKISVKAKLRSTDMPFTMQEHALSLTKSFLDDDGSINGSNRIKNCLLATTLKKEFDTRYGLAWHCVVGKSYGSYVTHSNGGFLYFSFHDSFFVLLFQTKVHLVTSTSS